MIVDREFLTTVDMLLMHVVVMVVAAMLLLPPVLRPVVDRVFYALKQVELFVQPLPAPDFLG